jgi:nucleotide sugar dehydrogenase
MQMQNQVAIVGMGYVGNAMLTIFPDAVQYDSKWFRGTRHNVLRDDACALREWVAGCTLAIVCVPTPSREDGSCDTSAVEEVVGWIRSPLILIKSAVCPGTTDRLRKETSKRIVTSPEYIGESRYFVPDRYLDPRNPLKHEFLILGGTDEDCEAVADIFAPRVGPTCRIRFMDAIEAEIVKYAENSFFATKVAFANELRDVCTAYGASWHRVREGWIDDPRVGPMHTAVFPRDRGFGGKCYPKDLAALAHAARKYDVPVPLLNGVLESNRVRRGGRP